jgi:hypothetical protein
LDKKKKCVEREKEKEKRENNKKNCFLMSPFLPGETVTQTNKHEIQQIDHLQLYIRKCLFVKHFRTMDYVHDF